MRNRNHPLTPANIGRIIARLQKDDPNNPNFLRALRAAQDFITAAAFIDLSPRDAMDSEGAYADAIGIMYSIGELGESGLFCKIINNSFDCGTPLGGTRRRR